MAFKIQHKVGMGDIDALNIVFFPNYADWVASCFLAYLKQQCVLTRNIKDDYEIRVVSIKINYILSACHDDLVDICVKRVVCDASIISILFAITINNKVVAKAKLSGVYVSHTTKKLIPLPEDVVIST